MTEEISDRLRIARERAARERKGTPNTVNKRATRARSHTPLGGDKQIADMRYDDPLGAVRAAQEAWFVFESTSMLNGHVRKVLTGDYEAAVQAVYKAGLRHLLHNATWPPIRPQTTD